MNGPPLQPSLMESRIQSSGRLRSRHLPALYLDPSFFAVYVAEAVRERDPDDPVAKAAATPKPAEAEALAEIRRRARVGTLGVTPVLTGVTVLQWAQDLAPLYHAGDREARHHGALEDADFEGFRFQGWLGNLLGDALEGVLQVDLVGFSLSLETTWDVVPGLALVDGAGRWSIHALAAHHLGCTHLATTEPDMVHVCEVLRSAGGPQPLLGPEALLTAAVSPE